MEDSWLMFKGVGGFEAVFRGRCGADGTNGCGTELTRTPLNKYEIGQGFWSETLASQPEGIIPAEGESCRAPPGRQVLNP